jgi:S1-C subfamily serine protease
MNARTVVAAAALLSLVVAPVGATDLSEVYKKVRASVVIVETTQKEVDPLAQGQLMSVGGLGSGTLISRDGKVLTAAHVVQTADQVSVHFMSGERIPARVVGSEPAADVALLQLERMPAIAQVAEIGDSDRVEVGHRVFVVGAPLGMSHTLTVGHISARRLESEVFGGIMPTELLQTDAAINQGNSGGPMFNMQGQVVGVVSYIISQGGGFEGLGFVITSNMAKRLLLDQRSMWSGMQGLLLTGDVARVFNVPQENGLLVQRVAERSPAAHIGIRGGSIEATIAETSFVVGGDIVLEVQGVSLDEEKAAESIRAKMNALADNEEIVVKVLRGGEIVELKNFFFSDLLVPSAPGESSK